MNDIINTAPILNAGIPDKHLARWPQYLGMPALKCLLHQDCYDTAQRYVDDINYIIVKLQKKDKLIINS